MTDEYDDGWADDTDDEGAAIGPPPPNPAFKGPRGILPDDPEAVWSAVEADNTGPRLTIQEWGKRTGVVCLDPDGFDRKDPQLLSRLFTEEEYRQGMMTSTMEAVSREALDKLLGPRDWSPPTKPREVGYGIEMYHDDLKVIGYALVDALAFARQGGDWIWGLGEVEAIINKALDILLVPADERNTESSSAFRRRCQQCFLNFTEAGAPFCSQECEEIHHGIH